MTIGGLALFCFLLPYVQHVYLFIWSVSVQLWYPFLNVSFMMQSMISFFMLDVYCSFKFFDARWELSVGGRCCGYHWVKMSGKNIWAASEGYVYWIHKEQNSTRMEILIGHFQLWRIKARCWFHMQSRVRYLKPHDISFTKNCIEMAVYVP